MPSLPTTLLVVLLVAAPTYAFFALLGRAALRAAAVDERPLTQWLVAPAIGAMCWSAPMFLVLSVAGFHAGLIWAGFAVALALSLLALARTGTAPQDRNAWPWAALGIGLLALLPILPLLPAIENGGLYFGMVVFDHVKIALIDSIFRQGLPPVSPYIAPAGEPAGLFYYYGWYLLGAQLRAVFGCSGYTADLALAFVTAALSLSLVAGIACRLGGSRAAIPGVLVLAPTLDLESLLGPLIGWDAIGWLKGWEWGLENWLGQSFWAPQHVFAGAAVLAGLLAVSWIVNSERSPYRLLPLLAACFAAAVTASIYAGAFAIAAIMLPAAALVLRRMTSWHALGAIAGAGVLAGLLIVPLLLVLATYSGNTKGALALWIYPSVGFADTGQWTGTLASLFGFWLILLPLRLGVTYMAGLWAMLRGSDEAENRDVLRPLLIAAALACLVVAQFVKSDIERNDLGWRIILPAVLILLAFAGSLIGGLIAALRRPERLPDQHRNAIAGLVLIGLAALPLGAQGVLQAIKHFVSDEKRGPPATHRTLAQQPAAWREVQRRTGPRDLVISNPTAFDAVTSGWGSNLPWALFADRPSLLSSANWAKLLTSHLRGTPVIADYTGLLARFFAGQATPADLDRLAGLKVRLALVTPLDALWTDDASIRAAFEKVAEGDGYRLYVPRGR